MNLINVVELLYESSTVKRDVELITSFGQTWATRIDSLSMENICQYIKRLPHKLAFDVRLMFVSIDSI